MVVISQINWQLYTSECLTLIQSNRPLCLTLEIYDVVVYNKIEAICSTWEKREEPRIDTLAFVFIQELNGMTVHDPGNPQDGQTPVIIHRTQISANLWGMPDGVHAWYGDEEGINVLLPDMDRQTYKARAKFLSEINTRNSRLLICHPLLRICLGCGIAYQQGRRDHFFHSAACRQRSRRSKV